MNAHLIAMDTAAAMLAALATGLIVAGRRGSRGPFSVLTGSPPCWQEARAGWLHLTFTPGTRRGHLRALDLNDPR